MSEMDGSSRLSFETVDPKSSTVPKPLTIELLEPNLELVLDPYLDDIIEPDCLDNTDLRDEVKEGWLNILGLAPPGHLQKKSMSVPNHYDYK